MLLLSINLVLQYLQNLLKVIQEVYKKHQVILDPHSAIAFGALKHKINLDGNNIVLATAHPCKFPEVINDSIGIKPALPEKLKYIIKEKENYDIITNNLNTIKKYIKKKIQ